MTFHLITPDTPAGWRHVRIQREGRKYSLRTWYLNLPFNDVDTRAMKLDAATEGISLAAALTTGQAIETWMVSQEPKSQRKSA